MPLANHISGPIGNGQSDSSNSTHALNATTWMFTTDNDMLTTMGYNENNFNHLWTFSTLYGTNYQSQNDSGNILNLWSIMVMLHWIIIQPMIVVSIHAWNHQLERTLLNIFQQECG